MSVKTYHGSCHCGAIRFEADLDLEAGTYRCNCSSCTKARTWFIPAALDAVRMISGEDQHLEYRWTPPERSESNLTYRFCKACGVRTVGKGAHGPDGKPFRFVAIASLNDAEPAVLAASLHYLDGRHDRFDRQPEDISLL